MINFTKIFHCRISLVELNKIDNFEIFNHSDKYRGIHMNGFKIVQITNSLTYSNCEEFRKKLLRIQPLKNVPQVPTLSQSVNFIILNTFVLE